MRPDSGEELNPLRREYSDIVRTQIESTAALQRPTVSEKIIFTGAVASLTFELCQKTTAVERAHVRLQQDQIRLLLKNGPHIRALRRGNVVPARERSDTKAHAQILGDTKQENLCMLYSSSGI